MATSASETMHIPPIKKEWNINTLIAVAGFFLTLAMTGGGMLWTYGQFTYQIGQNTKTIGDYRAATDLRIAKLETDTRQIDNLAYRLSAAEGVNERVSRVLDELQAAVAEQSGDLRVVREILQRIERQSTAQPAALRSNP